MYFLLQLQLLNRADVLEKTLFNFLLTLLIVQFNSSHFFFCNNFQQLSTTTFNNFQQLSTTFNMGNGSSICVNKSWFVFVCLLCCFIRNPLFKMFIHFKSALQEGIPVKQTRLHIVRRWHKRSRNKH